jgi:topoisomerase-4 subunit A
LADLAKGAPVVAAIVHRPGGKLLLATRRGRGFVTAEAEALAQTKAGRQVVNLAEGDRLAVVAPVEGELVAIAGTNRKILVFPLAELPEMARGRGVMLMRLKDAELADARTIRGDEGLAWTANGQPRRLQDLTGYLGKRAGAGRTAPRGFPKDHRFG